MATGYGIEAEFFGLSRRDAATAIQRAGVDAMAMDYNHDTQDFWKVVTDGSVYGGDGYELVSPILNFADGVESQTRIAMQAMRDNGARVDVTCGLHIHHDARGMSPAEVASTIGLYALFQPVINKFLPSSRHNGDYCHSLSEDTAIWAEREAARRDDIFERNSFSNERYSAINTLALHVHGTLEFRQHSGTLNAEKITHWKRLTKAFMIAGRRLNYHAVMNPYGGWESAQDVLNIWHLADILRLPDDTTAYFITRADYLERGRANPADDGEDIKANLEDESYIEDNESADICQCCGYFVEECQGRWTDCVNYVDPDDREGDY